MLVNIPIEVDGGDRVVERSGCRGPIVGVFNQTQLRAGIVEHARATGRRPARRIAGIGRGDDPGRVRPVGAVGAVVVGIGVVLLGEIPTADDSETRTEAAAQRRVRRPRRNR